MNKVIAISIASLSVSCNFSNTADSTTHSEIQNNAEQRHTIPEDGKKIESSITNLSPVCGAEFASFFEQFALDTSFQKTRLDNPLRLVLSDESFSDSTYKAINYVSFSQKDWDETIVLECRKISSDTVMVILEGIDTGVHIEHLFAKRNVNWHLFQINNSSD